MLSEKEKFLTNKRQCVDRRGRIGINNHSPFKQILEVTGVIILIWLVIALIISYVSVLKMEPYLDSSEYGYEAVSTIVTTVSSIWSSMVSGVATAAIAVFGVWWSIKNDREMRENEQSVEHMPCIKMQMSFCASKDYEYDDEPYITLGIRPSLETIHLFENFFSDEKPKKELEEEIPEEYLNYYKEGARIIKTNKYKKSNERVFL